MGFENELCSQEPGLQILLVVGSRILDHRTVLSSLAGLRSEIARQSRSGERVWIEGYIERRGNSSLSPPTRKETSEQIPGIMNKCVCVCEEIRLFGTKWCERFDGIEKFIDLSESLVTACETIVIPHTVYTVTMKKEQIFTGGVLQQDRVTLSSVQGIVASILNFDILSFSEIVRGEECSKRTIIIPILDIVVSEMSTRLSEPSNHVMSLFNFYLTLSPKETTSSDLSNLIQKLGIYKEDLPRFESLEMELEMWKIRCENSIGKPIYLLFALNICDGDTFPNIYTLLRIVCTLTVTACDTE
ncbi:unnamed protein product [Lepeophtheirus salmonis]|uniref:(salmon louse) hypothetical protein n=1 Tax=Lepeophtheirus salmonis TaxID=72036 RepID=A0A7R8D4R7_LEPSM|nr:unnamed protein product [Lepeophtheirus salmonis]CAF3027610.1 unnamed protein product [Lepeophtheirus salmonis]